MRKELIELQLGCPATAVVLAGNDCQMLENTVILHAEISDKYLFGMQSGPIFNNQLTLKSKVGSIVYLVITGIDKLSHVGQNRFEGLVKDRELDGYNLPENCIIVFTMEDINTLKSISTKLSRFFVVV